MNDQAAIDRYRYMLRTAPPDDIERAHAEAFERLTPEQRRQVLDALARDAPASEAPQHDDARSLARAATRAEMRQPGYMARTFGSGGPGLGGMFLSTIAGAFVGTAIAGAFFDDPANAEAAGDADGGGDAGAEGGDVGADDGGDIGGGDIGGGDIGGDLGGGDFGGF